MLWAIMIGCGVVTSELCRDADDAFQAHRPMTGAVLTLMALSMAGVCVCVLVARPGVGG